MLRPFWRLRKGLTLGAQGVVIDGNERVLLVRHSYRPGWFFPAGRRMERDDRDGACQRTRGGGRRESQRACPTHGIFANFASFPGDHIALFVVRHWRRNGDYRKPGEIAETGMFGAREMPDETDAGTRTRLREIFDRGADQRTW